MRRDRSWPRSNLASPAPSGVGMARPPYRTYLRPASQEKAADLLDLPFSTYQRYRDGGIDPITDWL